MGPILGRLGRLGPLGLLLFALGGVAVFLRVMHGHYPIDKWLFWTYARVWVCVLLCGAACLGSGDLVVTRLLRFAAPLRERVVISFAAGVFVYATGVFVAGLFHGLGAVFFYAWPLGLIVLGAPRLVRVFRRAARVLPHARRVAALPSWWSGLALVFGLAGAALLYVNILTPANVAYDSRWYHLAIAEHYASAGAISRFPEGWFCGTYPHLASFLYTWALLFPGETLFARVELAAHVEYLLFAFTLVGVGVLARWCVAAGGARVRNGWAALFLFPGILLYDSTLSVAADHVLAFWAPPIFLLLRRTLTRWNFSSAFLLGLTMAGAVLTKYQAVYLLVAPSVAMLVMSGRVVWTTPGSARARLKAALFPVGVLAGAMLLLTTPLWLKNWIWYHDPVYPMLAKVFGAHPWVPGADPDKFLQLTAWTPQGPLLDRVRQTLVATFTFSFVPHDWWNHHADVPVFGSLFTLSLPLLLFVKPRRRVLALAAATMIGLAIWYWTYHQDRYLQALLPWMAAVLAAVFAMVWKVGRSGRLAVGALIAAQLVWGGDIYTFPTHAMLGTPPAKAVMDLFSAGFRKDWAAHTQSHMDLAPVAPLVPKGSKVLVHERLPHMGIGAQTVADMPGTQAGISYATLGTPRRVYEHLRRLGVTHVLWFRASTYAYQTSVDDLVFFDFVEKHTVGQVDVAGNVLGKMSDRPPDVVSEPRLVRVQTCAGAKTVRIEQLDAVLAGAPVAEFAAGGLPAFHVVHSGCGPMPPESQANYRLLVNRTGHEMYGLKVP